MFTVYCLFKLVCPLYGSRHGCAKEAAILTLLLVELLSVLMLIKIVLHSTSVEALSRFILGYY